MLIASIALAIALAEGAARAMMPRWREYSPDSFSEAVWRDGYGSVVLGRANYTGMFSSNDGDFRIHLDLNEAGLREKVSVAQAAGRVWFLGDSFTFGWGVESGERFSDLAGVLTGNASFTVAMTNNDVRGYRALRSLVPAQAIPKAVVVGLTLENDVHPYPPLEAASNVRLATPSTLFRVKEALIARSAFYNLFALAAKRAPAVLSTFQKLGLAQRPHQENAWERPEDLAASVTQTVAEMARLRDSFPPSTPFAVLLIPARMELLGNDAFFRDMREELNREFAHAGISVIDPFEPLRAKGFATVHLPHDGHWTAEGHAVAARLVAEWLRACVD